MTTTSFRSLQGQALARVEAAPSQFALVDMLQSFFQQMKTMITSSFALKGNPEESSVIKSRLSNVSARKTNRPVSNLQAREKSINLRNRQRQVVADSSTRLKTTIAAKTHMQVEQSGDGWQCFSDRIAPTI